MSEFGFGEGDPAFQCLICPKCHDDHSQNRECKTIDLWEAGAKINGKTEVLYADGTTHSQRILALINLVRKKDEALKTILNEVPLREAMLLRPGIHESLALTEELK